MKHASKDTGNGPNSPPPAPVLSGSLKTNPGAQEKDGSRGSPSATGTMCVIRIFPQRSGGASMSIFNSIKQSVTNAANSMNSELKKFRSKDLLQAIVAGSTMIAYADGVVSAEEKQKLLGFVRSSEQLSVFESDKVIESFTQYLSRFEFDVTIAAGEALQKIAAFRGKPEAELIVRVCLAIAKADGNIDMQEQQALGQICQSLGLDVKNYL
jgi:tellurite resistance protein TerB